jgi:hypothetical protein
MGTVPISPMEPLYGTRSTRYIPRPMIRTFTKKGTKTKPAGALDACA